MYRASFCNFTDLRLRSSVIILSGTLGILREVGDCALEVVEGAVVVRGGAKD